MALATQVPLTALMVVYTFVGLSITAEPIVESRAAAEPAAAATRRRGTRGCGAARTAAAACGRWVPARRAAEAHLQGAGLGLPRWHQDRRRGPPLCLRFRLPLGHPGRGPDAHYDPFVDAATAPMRRHLVAVRVVGVDTASKSFRVGDVDFVREVFTVEVYLDIAPEEPEWNALVAPPWSTLPWPVLALMEEAVGAAGRLLGARKHGGARPMARPRPIERAGRQACRARRRVRARRLGRRPCAQ